MSIAQLLTKLEELNIYIDVIDDTLKVQAPDGKLTTALIKELKEKKQDIIDFFQKNDQERKYISIPPAAEKAYYELSSAQMRMYFLQQMNLNNTVYNITQFIKLGALKGADNREEPGIDVKKLEDTFKRLIERHESLRTSFRMVKGRPTQKIHKEVDFKIEFFNKVADFVRTFDLTQAPLIRIGIIEAGPEDRLLGIDMHHIICDGVSYKILVRDFYSLYRNESQLPPLRIHYKDYTEWQNSQKQKEAIKKQETYWLKEFPGEIPIIDIPTDFPRPAIQSFEGRKLFYEITGETALMLTNMALENGTTLYIILLSILNILWSKLSSQEDIIMGTPTAGRLHADLENIIGMFVNTLTLRNYPGKEKTFKAFLHEVNQRTIEAFENQDYPFEDLVEKLAVKRDASRNPMFDLMFAWQDINSNVKSEISHYSKPLSRFDLTWGGMGNKYHLFFDIEYCTKLFEEDTILRFIEFFKRITSSIIECSDRKIAQIEIITEEEKNRILYDFNDSEMTYPREKTIHQLFEEQSAKIPDNIAVAGPSLIVNHESFLHITYRELNKKSNLLVQVLQHNGGDPETPPFVGIIMKPFTEMITGIIGILKFGGAYLPIDPGYPQERIDYMLKDSGAKLLVTTNDKEVEKVRSWEGEQILLEFITHHSNQLSIHHSSFDIPRIHHSSRLAYLIYTSGTTGKPKGVTVEHRNVVNVITWFGRLYGLKPGVHVLQMSSYTFDASIDQIFGTLIHGGSLYVIRKNMLMDMFALRRFICSRCIHVINFVPSLLYELLCSDGWERLDSLKVVISGAEKLDDEIKRRILHLDYRLFNQYGPTETTIDALVSECSKQKVNLGKPIANVKCYICDPYNNVLPIGIAGELLVSGAGVARGYLNHPELTAEKFIDFHHSITFRTGDLCRWLPDGNIEFLGRIDNQLKIRGHRIELGEIESILLNYKGIKDVLVAAHGEGRGDKCLCAYIVSSEKLTASLLREYLTGRLPDYMIPSYFVQLEKIPLNANGKINWRDLPDPVLEVGDAYVPPQNEIEEKLVDIWSDVLGIEKTKIGRDHNFFELGGNSLKLICLADRIYKEFKLDISIVAQIYNQPRIRDLAVSFIKNNLSEQPVVLLNWEREKKIFGFPDQFGFGYNYANLGALLKDYSLYSLTFIDDDDRIKRYINVITDIQPIGPYVFFGHSAAGKLTCVIAAALEKLGLEVSDIIFADCFFVENTAVGDDEEYYKGLRKGVARFLESNKSEFLLEKVFTKAVNYTKFRDNIAGLEKINANIHLIISEEIQQRISDFSNLHCWDKLTSRRTQIYNGWGRHQEMLSGSDLQKNIKIIKNILNEIDFGKKTVSKGKEI